MGTTIATPWRPTVAKRLRNRAAALAWLVRHTLQRYGRAYRYARGCMSPDDADEIRYECQEVGGFWPLETLTVDGMMETVIDRFGDSEEVRLLVADACARVGSKWDSDGHLRGAAQDWAMDLIKERAEELGLVDGEDAGQPAGTQMRCGMCGHEFEMTEDGRCPECDSDEIEPIPFGEGDGQ
jgi:hypothetical protein